MKSEWIAVEDRLPQEYEPVLVFFENFIHIAERQETPLRSCTGWYFEDGEIGFIRDSDAGNLMFWMPLPDDPDMEAERTRPCDEVGKKCSHCNGETTRIQFGCLINVWCKNKDCPEYDRGKIYCPVTMEAEDA